MHFALPFFRTRRPRKKDVAQEEELVGGDSGGRTPPRDQQTRI